MTFFGSLTYLPQALADPAMLRWIGALVLLVVMLLLLREFVRAVRYEPPRIESHWGGIGGGLGGWHISPSLAYLVAAIAFGAMFTTILPPAKGDSKSAGAGPEVEKKAPDKREADAKEAERKESDKKEPDKRKAPDEKEPDKKASDKRASEKKE
jgi:hypothetical protein